MAELTDHELLTRFARNGDEAAFAALVTRHVNLVWSAARRFTGDDTLASEVTQAVFIILAQKAGRVSAQTVLTGWLYQTARLTAANALKENRRRQQREHQAYMEATLTPNETNEAWQQLAPVLDEAMHALRTADRDAVLLRYFENKSLADVGAALGVTEDAARVRVNRALDKLRALLAKQGIKFGATAIATAVVENSVQAAPTALAAKVSMIAAKGLATTSITTLVNGTMKTMTWVKMKFAMSLSVVVVLSGSLLTMAITNKANEEKTVPPTGSHTGVSFFSVLEKPPIITNAVFEKEVFIPGIPDKARKQTFTFLADGDNYRLSTQGIGAGKFEGICWQQLMGNLSLFDTKINQLDGNSGGIIQQEAVCRMTVDIFLSLGIQDMLPGSALWDQDKHRFTAKAKDGKGLVVETTLTNGVPAVAYILADDGQQIEKVEYKYSPGFYDGQLPIEFTAYWIKPGAKNESQKIYDIRVKALEIADEPLDQDILNPAKIDGTSTTMIYSNNIAFWIDKGGKVRRLLTVEENRKEIEKIKASQAK